MPLNRFQYGLKTYIFSLMNDKKCSILAKLKNGEFHNDNQLKKHSETWWTTQSVC